MDLVVVECGVGVGYRDGAMVSSRGIMGSEMTGGLMGEWVWK